MKRISQAADPTPKRHRSSSMMESLLLAIDIVEGNAALSDDSSSEQSAPILAHSEVSDVETTQLPLQVQCWHACVAQKSYGQEKRFMVPPPKVVANQRNVQISVEVAGSSSAQTLTSTTDQSVLFRQLHIQNNTTDRVKGFHLNVSLGGCSFTSQEIQLISKPSKKAASQNLLSGSSVAFYNRINNQNNRTRYIKSMHDRDLVADSADWTPVQMFAVTTTPTGETMLLPEGSPILYDRPVLITPENGSEYGRLCYLKRLGRGGEVLPAAGESVCQLHRVAIESVSRPGTYLSIQPLDNPEPQVPLQFTESHGLLADSQCWSVVGVCKLSL